MKKVLQLIAVGLLFSTISQAATITFNTVHPGTSGVNYIKSTQSIAWTTTMNAASGYSSLKFSSANPADVTFNGNDVAGQFSYYYNGQKYIVNGTISRPSKTGNTDDAYYFFETTVLGGTTSTYRAWLFVVPGRESAISSSPTTTSSDPIDKALNSLLTTQNALADPVITSDGGGATAAITKAENISAVTTVTANVSGATKIFSITGGVDASKFTIDSSTGVLTFVSAPNYENPTDAGLNNVYDVQVTVTDAQGTTDTQAIAVTITNTNDNSPVITSNGAGATATVGVVAGTTSVTTVTATDADYGDVLTYSISGGTNSDLFSINPTTGALTFKTAAVNGSYQVIVTVTDAIGHTDTQTLTVNVTSTDTTPPSLVITASDTNLSAGEVTTIYFKFSEPVQGFTSGDVNLNGSGSLGTITQSATDPTLYTASYTQSGSSLSPTLTVANNTYTDMSNNNGTGNTLNMTADLTPPTVAVSFGSVTKMAFAETKTVTFTFSENPGTSFTTSDVTVVNGSISGLIQTATPTIWTASLLSTSAVAGPVVTVNNLSYSDPAGNLGSSGTNSLGLLPPSIDLANTPTSDTGISYTDNITSATKPVLTGKYSSAGPIPAIEIDYYVNSVLTKIIYKTNGLNNIVVNPVDSTFTLDLNTATPTTGTMPSGGLPNGNIGINITDGASSPTTLASSSFIIDTTPPVAPTVNSQTTPDSSPTLTGTATVQDGDIFTVTVNSVTYTNGDGNLSVSGTNWTLVIPTTNRISSGTYPVTATVTDAAGNPTSDATTNELTISPTNVTIDLANNSTDDTGISSTDNITANRKPVINGTDSYVGVTSVKVTVVSGGYTYTYNTVAVTSGNWSLDLASATPSSIIPTGTFPSAGLPSGTVNLTVEENSSGATNTSSFLIDYTAPTAPTVNSQTTANPKPTITGTGTFSTGDILHVTINGVTYTSGDGNLSYNAGAGTWSLTIPNANALSVAAYPTTATITDAAGNVSATGSGTTTIVSATATVDLANTAASDTGTSSTDNLTSNRKPAITGTATYETVVTVTVTQGGTSYTYNNVAVIGGNWSLDLSSASTTSGAAFPGTGLTTGTWTLGVTGNTTGATGSNTFVEDYSAPTAPTVNSQTTWNPKPTITGTGTFNAGDILHVTINGVTYTSGDGNLSYNTGASTWSLTIPNANALSVAAYPTTATITDAAGNVSATGSGTTTITQPTVTADLANTSGSDTGTSSTDNLTSNRKPVINGTASDDAVVTVTVTQGGTTYTYNNVAVSGGNWSLDLSSASTTSGAAFPGTGLTTGTWTLGVTGNTTGATGSNTFVEDYTAPVAPTVNFLTTTDTTPTLTGTATVSAGDLFTVSVHGVTYTDGDGNLSYSGGTWTLNIPAGNEIPVNTYTVVATVTDAAGNSISNSSTNQLVINGVVVDVQTYNLITSPTFTTATINWSNGSRTSRVVFMKEGSGSISNPVNNNSYAASTNWTIQGDQLGSSGYYCIYNGTGSSVKVTGLYPGRLYTIQAFEYNGSAGSENYLTNLSGTNNPATVTPWPTTTFYNSNGVSSQEAWHTAARWDHDTIPTANLHPAVQVYIDGNCVVTGQAECNNLTIYAAHSSISPKLTINAGKSLNVIGPFANIGTAAALLVKASAVLPEGTLTWGTGTINGSVEMYSPASWNLSNEVNNRYKWQFFGIPVTQTTAGNTFNFSTCYLRKWDESVINYFDVWVRKNDGTTLYENAGSTLYSGLGYELVQEVPTIYTFSGELVHSDLNMSLSYSPSAIFAGQHVLGNPYTAAIDIASINFGDNTEQAVYQYTTGTYKNWLDNGGQNAPGKRSGQHMAASKNTAGKNSVPAQIPSMQGFIVKSIGATGSITIPYVTALKTDTAMIRTKRSMDAAVQTSNVSTRIDVVSDNYADRMWIFTDPSCTRSYDNGWDGRKIASSVDAAQLYAVEPDGNYQIDAVNEMNDTYLAFKSGADVNYKLIFNHENINTNYAAVFVQDLTTNEIKEVTSSGSVYSFTAVPNSNMGKRFKIITGTRSNDQENSSKLKIFHNQNSIIIRNETAFEGEYVLYGLSGIASFRATVSASGITTVATSNFTPGIYIVKANTQADKAVAKIIIE